MFVLRGKTIYKINWTWVDDSNYVIEKEIDFVLRAVQDHIDELEIHRNNAFKFRMKGPADEIETYIEVPKHKG